MIRRLRKTEQIAMRTTLRWPHALLVACLAMAGCASLPSAENRLASLQQDSRQALESGDHTSALVALREAHGLEPDNPETLELLLTLYNQLGERDNEAAAALQLLAVEPDHPQALMRMGQLSLQRGNLTVAAEHFQRATESDPEQWAAWNGLGIIADSQGHHDEAQAHFHRSLDVLPGHPRVLANLGWSLLLSGSYTEAEERLRESLEIEPASETTRSNLAYALALQGKYQQAAEHYRTLYDEHTTANNLGQAALQRGDENTARDYLRRAVQLSPRYYEKAARALEQIESGEQQPSLFTLP